jgi:hypothetical protein
MIIDQDFVNQYLALLISQYTGKPKAEGEISALSTQAFRLFKFFDEFCNEFDLDNAYGHRLDLLGKDVGANRVIPFRSIDPETGEPITTIITLDDNDFRFIIRSKVAKNFFAAYMVSDERLSLQEVIQFLFQGKAYVEDNKDMSLTMFLSETFPIERLELILQLDLIPRPAGVFYRNIIRAEIGSTFGFSDNLNSIGFGDKFDPSVEGGVFAQKVVF